MLLKCYRDSPSLRRLAPPVTLILHLLDVLLAIIEDVGGISVELGSWGQFEPEGAVGTGEPMLGALRNTVECQHRRQTGLPASHLLPFFHVSLRRPRTLRL